MKFWIASAISACILLTAILVTSTVWRYQFDVGCGGHLKRAADANTVERAKQELGTAIKYARDNHLTTGSSHIWFKSPSTDLDFWYDNLEDAYAELGKVDKSTTQLERSNVLMKLRETLLDHTADGDEITLPDNIALYPVQGQMEVVGLVQIFWLGVCGVAIFTLLIRNGY